MQVPHNRHLVRYSEHYCRENRGIRKSYAASAFPGGRVRVIKCSRGSVSDGSVAVAAVLCDRRVDFCQSLHQSLALSGQIGKRGLFGALDGHLAVIVR